MRHVTTKWPGNLRELAVETRMNSASIFDLSPSEKLQLVEDLWDDLGAAPEAVPDLREAPTCRRSVGRPCGRAGGRARPRLAKAGTGTQEGEPTDRKSVV